METCNPGNCAAGTNESTDSQDNFPRRSKYRSWWVFFVVAFAVSLHNLLGCGEWLCLRALESAHENR